MRQAVRLARKGLGRTSPNPAVGAVIVRNGRIIAEGYHRRAGVPHAEVDALRKIGGKARGSTLYVTLEPCNHYGRTPPCTDAILTSGIKRVVVGMKDPNPGVAGGGCEYLVAHNVEVKIGVLEDACRELNEAFVKYVFSGKPFVTLKSAQTLDGWTATATGDSKWITNERSREYVHRLRDQADAVMVGVGTVLADDPKLTCRLKRGKGKDPLRIVVDTHLRTPINARILHQDSSAETMLVIGSHLKDVAADPFQRGKNRIIRCPTGEAGIDMVALLDILGKKGIMRLLVEGGAGISGSLLRARLVDKCYIFKAPKLVCGGDGVPMASGTGCRMMKDCLSLKNIRIRRLDDDMLVMGYPDYGAPPQGDADILLPRSDPGAM